MVGVITLNLQKKCILVAKKGCNLQWQISYALLFFKKNFLFLDQFFLRGFDNHSDLKKKDLITEKKFSQKRNCAYELFHLSATLFQLLRRFNPNASSYLTGQMDKFSWCIFLWEKLPSYNRAWLLNVSNQVHLYPLLKREIYNMQESSKAKLEFEPKTSLTCN